MAGVFPSPRCHHRDILSFGRRLSIAALPLSWHPLVWPASFHRRAAILESSRLDGVFHRHAAIFGILSLGRRLSIAALPSQYPRLSGVFHRRATTNGAVICRATFSHFGRRLSIAAPPSLILAGSSICRATISYLGPHTHLPCRHLFNWLAHSTARVPISYLPASSIAAPPFHGCATNPLSCNVTVLFWPVLLHDFHDQPLARHFCAPYEPDSHCSRHLSSSYLTLRGTPLKLVYFFGYPFSTRAASFEQLRAYFGISISQFKEPVPQARFQEVQGSYSRELSSSSSDVFLFCLTFSESSLASTHSLTSPWHQVPDFYEPIEFCSTLVPTLGEGFIGILLGQWDGPCPNHAHIWSV